MQISRPLLLVRLVEPCILIQLFEPLYIRQDSILQPLQLHHSRV